MADAAPFENPLIPNARLRQMYLAMLRARLVEAALPVKRRSNSRGLEACLVAPVIDLGHGDLIGDALVGGTVAFLRGAALHTVLEPGTRSRRRGVLAEAGLGRALPVFPDATARLWGALGAAAALWTGGSRQNADADEGSTRPAAVVFIRPGEIRPAELRRMLEFAASELLPAVFVVLPSPSGARSRARAESTLIGAAQRAGVPGMAVDGADAVALYRVAQESLGRARAGGGPALMECVPFFPHGVSRARQTADPVAAIERYILERRIITPDWIQRQTRGFARLLPEPVH